MELDLVPLLETQRALYAMPRGGERFRAYLRTLVDGDTGDLALPLVSMNPMGKDHLPVLLDTLLAFDAEAVARAAIEETTAAVADVDGRFRVGLVVADDAHGGWTDRTSRPCVSAFSMAPARCWCIGMCRRPRRRSSRSWRRTAPASWWRPSACSRGTGSPMSVRPTASPSSWAARAR